MKVNIPSAFAPRQITSERTLAQRQIHELFNDCGFNQHPSEFFNPETVTGDKIFNVASVVEINDALYMVDGSTENNTSLNAISLDEKSTVYEEKLKECSPLYVQSTDPLNSYISIDQLEDLIESESDIAIDNYQNYSFQPVESDVEFTDVVHKEYRHLNKTRRETENELNNYAKYLISKYSSDINDMVTRTEKIIEQQDQWIKNTDMTQFDSLMSLDPDHSKELTTRIKQDSPLGTQYQSALEIGFRTTVGSKISNSSSWSFFLAHRLMLQFGNIDCLTTFQRRNSVGDSLRDTLYRLPEVELNDTVYYMKDEESFVQVDAHICVDDTHVLINIIDPYNRQEWECLDNKHPATLEKAAQAHTKAFGKAPYVVHVSPNLLEPPVIHHDTLKGLLSI